MRIDQLKNHELEDEDGDGMSDVEEASRSIGAWFDEHFAAIAGLLALLGLFTLPIIVVAPPFGIGVFLLIIILALIVNAGSQLNDPYLAADESDEPAAPVMKKLAEHAVKRPSRSKAGQPTKPVASAAPTAPQSDPSNPNTWS